MDDPTPQSDQKDSQQDAAIIEEGVEKRPYKFHHPRDCGMGTAFKLSLPIQR